jgi:hypothetical protein
MLPPMLRIAARFCGPPESGNGGYCAGSLARLFLNATGGSGAVEVTLRKPPPLERDLELHLAGDQARLQDGEELIAEARSAEIEVDPPSAPSFERACQLSKHYVGHVRHHFPSCFVCGPARSEGDGLRIFPGSQHPGEPVAAPWVPAEGLAGADRQLTTELLWAALDCTGYFAAGASDYPMALLGRMTAQIEGQIAIGEHCVVTGFALGREGRKLFAGTALYGEDGTRRALSIQTWILVGGSVPPPPDSMRSRRLPSSGGFTKV